MLVCGCAVVCVVCGSFLYGSCVEKVSVSLVSLFFTVFLFVLVSCKLVGLVSLVSVRVSVLVWVSVS